MNVDTGQLGTLDELLRDARPGERVIPATIIGSPRGKYANKNGRKGTPIRTPSAPTARGERVLYGPRRPLREVRAELQAAAEV